MTNEDLIKHFTDLGWKVEIDKGVDCQNYIVVRDYKIPVGALQGRTCDVAILETTAVPYTAPPAIHTSPALVPMDMNRYRTQNSGIGSEWQYWSRVLRVQPTPQVFVAHIATIFSEIAV